MPRAGDEYSLPAGTAAVASTLANSSHVNSRFNDLAAEQNLARPVSKGGTGATSASAALVNLGLTATAAELNILDGATVTTAELNVLDGIPGTLTATEIGYLDGVTSAVQAQLDAKQATITTLPLANGGTGAALADPGADRILFWDDSAGAVGFLAPSTGTAITGTNLTAGAAVANSGDIALSGAGPFAQTGIPSTARKIRIYLEGASLSGTDYVQIQIGDSGGYETTGYSANSDGVNGTSLSGFPIRSVTAATVITGILTLEKHPTTNRWTITADGLQYETSNPIPTNGSKLLSATLDRIQVLASGANTFDAGNLVFEWES